MTTLTIPRHTRNLYQFTPDARAALLHQDCAARAITWARVASNQTLSADMRKFYREMARGNAADARLFFAQWQEARR